MAATTLTLMLQSLRTYYYNLIMLDGVPEARRETFVQCAKIIQIELPLVRYDEALLLTYLKHCVDFYPSDLL